MKPILGLLLLASFVLPFHSYAWTTISSGATDGYDHSYGSSYSYYYGGNSSYSSSTADIQRQIDDVMDEIDRLQDKLADLRDKLRDAQDHDRNNSDDCRARHSRSYCRNR